MVTSCLPLQVSYSLKVDRFLITADLFTSCPSDMMMSFQFLTVCMYRYTKVPSRIKWKYLNDGVSCFLDRRREYTYAQMFAVACEAT